MQYEKENAKAKIFGKSNLLKSMDGKSKTNLVFIATLHACMLYIVNHVTCTCMTLL